MDLPIEDVVELGQLCATYAVKLTQGDIHYVIEHLCTDDGTYSAFGETYSLDDWPALVAAAPKGLFLCGEPALQLDGDEGTGEVPAPVHRPDEPPHADGVVQRHLSPHR